MKGGEIVEQKKQLFETYILENLDSAYRFAYTYAKKKEDAEDIVSESIVKALKSIHQLKNPQYMKVWFYRIIVNTSLTFLKGKHKVIALGNEDLEEKAGVEDTYDKMTFQDMIESLDEKYKIILVLRFFEDMTLSEIAHVLELNENTVKTRFYKALKLLRWNLEKEEFDEEYTEMEKGI